MGDVIETPVENSASAQPGGEDGREEAKGGIRPLWLVAGALVGLVILSLAVEQRTLRKSNERLDSDLRNVVQSVELLARQMAESRGERARLELNRRRVSEWAKRQQFIAYGPDDPLPEWAKISKWQRAKAKEAGLPVAREFLLGGWWKKEVVPLRMVYVPPGSFMMGAAGRTADEQPPHKVTISSGFYLAIHETTQAQWLAVMGYNPSRHPSMEHPVEQVSWDDCQAFLERLNWLGYGLFRLPTEAEWEYACRAPDGASPEEQKLNTAEWKELGWFGEPPETGTHHPVATKKPNAWGLYDMIGNVWEWCEDYYGPYAAEEEIDPRGPFFGETRVVRGGAYSSTPERVGPTVRYGRVPPHMVLHQLGFRILWESPK